MNKFNKKVIWHGYWEIKHTNGKPWYKCTNNNGILFGYLEAYDTNSKIHRKQINI